MAVQGYDTVSISHQKNRYGFQYPGNKAVADSQEHHQGWENMSNKHHDRLSNPKSGMSRLEQLRMGYQERLLHEKEQKLSQLFQTQSASSQSRAIKSKSGGTVREFFAERRALENTEFARRNPENLPPIQHHFKKVKQQKLTEQGEYVEKNTALARTGPGRGEIKSISAPANARRHMYQRAKPRAGIDRQNPLPSLRPRNDKQESVYLHYETEANLLDSGRLDTVQQTFSPHPPVSRKQTNNSKPQRPLISQSPSIGSVDNMKLDMADAMTPPKLSRLKQLRAKRLSQTKMETSESDSPKQMKESQKLTDFQKWQLDQDEERAQRLEKHRKKNNSESSGLSISQQERELLEKIKREKEKLEQIQREQHEVEEKQRREKEEEEKWLEYHKGLEKLAEEMEKQKEKMEKETKRNELMEEKLKSQKRQTLKPESPIVKTENIYNTGEDDDANIDHEQENYFKSYYEIQANTAPTADEAQVDFSTCSVCRRNFATERLAKHQNVCAKNAQKKRKVFDLKKMRMQGTEMEQYIGKKDLGEPTKPIKKSNWRAQHENFVKTIRYAKGQSEEPPPVTENPDYVQCPHCNRKFNEAAGERHIPRCKDIKAKPTFLKRKK